MKKKKAVNVKVLRISDRWDCQPILKKGKNKTKSEKSRVWKNNKGGKDK